MRIYQDTGLGSSADGRLYTNQGRKGRNRAIRTTGDRHTLCQKTLGTVESTVEIRIDLSDILLAIEVEKAGLGHHRTPGLR